ncbi:uncharacterized protein LOC107043527 [Diachasma alloeum]|uniref:uncharacterized protein LOC107043527 n=1 Tax=Diachasma alloeum TaxID=454923 RepID=UPI0007384B28|nr:uncharacterized protein LOC107043527 [Diachasma alloeum]
MATLEALISLQMTRASFIDGIYTELQEESIQQFGVTALDSKLVMLETYWAKLEASHEKLVGQKIENLTSLDYFKNQVFDVALKHYASGRVALLQLLEKKGAPNLNQSVRVPGDAQLQSSTRRALPEIELPKFSGVYKEWRPWRDLFHSLAGNNLEIPGVERMYYLRLHLSNEPLKLISNLPVSEDSFGIAWRILVDRYENKRLLIAAHLDPLLNPAPMKMHGASDLNLLTSSVSEALSGKIKECKEAWENKIGASTEYPTPEHLLDFLQGRSRATETLEVGSSVHTSNDASRPSQPSVQTGSMTKSSAKVNQASVSSHAQQSAQKSPSPAQIQSTKSTSWADAGYPCSYCKMDHNIASCSGFKSLTPTARKEVVERLYLCYNCPGKHSIRVCQTTRTCRTCQERHHSLLHFDRARRPAQRGPASQVPRNDAGAQRPSASAPSTNVPVVTYTHTGDAAQAASSAHSQA